MYDTYIIILICSSRQNTISTSWTHNTLHIFHSETITDLLTYYSLIHFITFAPLSSIKLFLHCVPFIFFRRHRGSINLECFLISLPIPVELVFMNPILVLMDPRIGYIFKKALRRFEMFSLIFWDTFDLLVRCLMPVSGAYAYSHCLTWEWIFIFIY